MPLYDVSHMMYVYIPYNRGYMVYIQARPLERGPLRAPTQGDGLVCLVLKFIVAFGFH